MRLVTCCHRAAKTCLSCALCLRRGAFFQTQADTGEREDVGVSTTVAARDFSAPTGEDKMDKAMLPQIMQVGWCRQRKRDYWG